jgi:hypothetical protein
MIIKPISPIKFSTVNFSPENSVFFDRRNIGGNLGNLAVVAQKKMKNIDHRVDFIDSPGPRDFGTKELHS